MAGAMLIEAEPIPSASILVVRDDPFEVLMLRRHALSSFAPNAWVFPGGVVEPGDEELARALADGSTMATMRFAAARETFEEAGIWLGAPLSQKDAKRQALLAGDLPFHALTTEAPLELERLMPASRWITPEGIPKRFDTWFFIAAVSRDVEATAERTETTEAIWISPEDALAAAAGMHLMFPTLSNLEAIATFHDSAALLEARRGATIETMRPVLIDGKPTLP